MKLAVLANVTNFNTKPRRSIAALLGRANWSQYLRRTLPYPLRVEIARIRHEPKRYLEWRRCATIKNRASTFAFTLASDASPLHRSLAKSAPKLSAGKVDNIHAAASRIDGVVIEPGQTFSYYALIGRPSVWRGFRRGLEIHNESMAAGVGGGACKVTNLLYRLALTSGLQITERHRHSLDLFPDKDRTVPFGLGATVFYNYADLQFRNPFSTPVQIRIAICGPRVAAAVHGTRKLPWTIELYESDHRFTHDKSGFIRENKIHRRFRCEEGRIVRDELVATNRARVLYQPDLALCE